FRFLWVMLLVGLASCGVNPDSSEQPFDGASIHLVWSQELGAPINSPPLRIGNVLIVAPVGKPLVGLNAETGETLWQYDPGVMIWDRAYGTDGKRLFIGIDGGRYVALNPVNGKQIWETSLGINSQMAPFISGGIVYVPTTFAGPGLIGDPTGKAKLVALSTEDGRVLWDFESDNYVLQTPFRQGDVLYVGGSFSSPIEVNEGGHMRLYALNAANGSVKWKFESEDGFIKQLYATDKFISYIAYRDFIVGLDSSSGELKYQADTGNWVPTLSGHGEAVFYGSANTSVHAVDINTGRDLWLFNIPEGTFNYLAGAPVYLPSNELVFLTQQGDIFSLNASTGDPLWHFQTDTLAPRTGLSVSNRWIYLSDSDGILYAYTD
ncbi:MAG TPA: PQQ-binding-like beta-propeller repeat protein, partial [Anaerolineales bacterium]|nr:PQQ-binding-like beta-propeller repeat protein [Anaerolineales bacterium]